MSDILSAEKINRLGRPIFDRLIGGGDWEIAVICVQTGLIAIDACGKFQNIDASEVSKLQDSCGVDHDFDDFYFDCEEPQ